jgi:segregation and condensation protein B
MDDISLQIESLLFAAESPLNIAQIQETLENLHQRAFPDEDIQSRVEQIREKFAGADFAFEIRQINAGFAFYSKPAFHETIATFLKIENPKKLSRAAMETLSIIAYKQPVSKAEIDHVRGVNSDYTLQKLLEKDLVSITGRGDGPGRPLLYGTSEKFMEHFGLKDLSELPRLEDFNTEGSHIGEPGPKDILFDQEKEK